jgi:hypothetical protein
MRTCLLLKATIVAAGLPVAAEAPVIGNITQHRLGMQRCRGLNSWAIAAAAAALSVCCAV